MKITASIMLASIESKVKIDDLVTLLKFKPAMRLIIKTKVMKYASCRFSVKDSMFRDV